MKYSLAQKLAVGIFFSKLEYTPAGFFMTNIISNSIFFQVKGPRFLCYICFPNFSYSCCELTVQETKQSHYSFLGTEGSHEINLKCTRCITFSNQNGKYHVALFTSKLHSLQMQGHIVLSLVHLW